MNVAIQDHLKFYVWLINRRLTATNTPKVANSNKSDVPPVDYSLKEGQSISISIGGITPKPSSTNAVAVNDSADFSKCNLFRLTNSFYPSPAKHKQQ